MIKMLLKFGVVGLSGVGINMAVYVPLTAMGWNYQSAAIGSFIVAVTNNFVWNMLWTFRGRAMDKSLRRKYISFFAISLVNLGVNLLALRFFVEGLALKDMYAQLLSIAIVSVSNFILNYLITFGEHQDPKAKEVASCEAGYHPNVQ